MANKTGWGGARPGSGRPRGGIDAGTAEQKRGAEVLAREYAELAIEALVDVARDTEQPGSRVVASKALLDRGYGRPREAIAVDMNTTVTDGNLTAVPLTNSARLTADEQKLLVHLQELAARETIWRELHQEDAGGGLGRFVEDYRQRRAMTATERTVAPTGGPKLPLVMEVLMRLMEAEIAWLEGDGDDFGVRNWRDILKERGKKIWI